MRTPYRPWITYLLLGLFLAAQVPSLIGNAEWARAGLVAVGAVAFLTIGAIRTRRRLRARAEHQAPSTKRRAGSPPAAS